MSENVKELTMKNFKAETLGGDTPILVDFWAEWCGPCRMIAPSVERLASECAGKLKVCKVNVDDAPDLAGQYEVMSVPTLILLKGGNQVDRMVGARSFPDLKRWVDQHI